MFEYNDVKMAYSKTMVKSAVCLNNKTEYSAVWADGKNTVFLILY